MNRGMNDRFSESVKGSVCKSLSECIRDGEEGRRERRGLMDG